MRGLSRVGAVKTFTPRHVSDEQNGERPRTMTSAKQACEALLNDALDGGGSDNITIILGRAVARA